MNICETAHCEVTHSAVLAVIRPVADNIDTKTAVENFGSGLYSWKSIS